MGAATHLGINLSEYDAVIRTLIPHYDELIDAAGAAVGALARPAGVTARAGGVGISPRAGVARMSTASLVGMPCAPTVH